MSDPIIEELHRIRAEHAARFNDDLRAIAEDLRRVEREWPGPTLDAPARWPLTDDTSAASSAKTATA